jgi:hypothetical protein
LQKQNPITLRQSRVKRYHARPAEAFYHVTDDPSELRNRAIDPMQSERLKTLRADLDIWMKTNGDDGLAIKKAHPHPRTNRK